MTDQEIQGVIESNGGNFKPSEFLNNRHLLPKKIIEASVQFRNWHGFSTQITSAWRESGSHNIGAIDALIWEQWKVEQPSANQLWLLVTTWPWMGVGIYFDWDDGVGLHMDLCTSLQRTRPLRWLRTDKDYYYQSTQNGLFENHKTGETISLEAAIDLYNKEKSS